MSYWLAWIITLIALYQTAAQEINSCNPSTTRWDFTCNAQETMVVQLMSIDADIECKNANNGAGGYPVCTQPQIEQLKQTITNMCREASSCHLTSINFPGGSACSAFIKYICVKGNPTTARMVVTTPVPEDAWKSDFTSWQWVIIFIVIAVVVIALIILIVMLANHCCYKCCHQEKKPKFSSQIATPEYQPSTLTSRTASLSTLHRSTPKRPATAEEIEEIKVQFGTNKKKKETPDRHFGQGSMTLESRRSDKSDDQSKFNHNDDSSSGIGSATYDGRQKHGMYDDADTCHDDFVSFTMKKQALAPVLNGGFGSNGLVKTVDEGLYKDGSAAPTVGIIEDRREENFRMDINSWTINAPGDQKLPETGNYIQPGVGTIVVEVGADKEKADVAVDVEAESDAADSNAADSN